MNKINKHNRSNSPIRRSQTPEAYKRFRKYQNSFIKKNYKTYLLRFSKSNDDDIIEILESQNNCAEFLRQAILEYDKKQNN